MRRKLTFQSGIGATSRAWTEGVYELYFHDRLQSHFEPSGVFYFTLPAAELTPGQPVTLEVLGVADGGGIDWYMLHAYTDTITYETGQGTLQHERIGTAEPMTTPPPPPPDGPEQALDGFGAIVAASNSGNYVSYRGDVQSWWEYAGSSEFVEWTTPPVPAGYTTGRVTFVWSGRLGGEFGDHVLFLNGDSKLTFQSGIGATSRLWTNGAYELYFDDRLRSHFEPSGAFYFTVPASELSPGQPAALRVVGTTNGGGIDWYLLHAYTDTITYETGQGTLQHERIGRADASVPDSDGDGYRDDVDACIRSDLAATVVIDDCDSLVANLLLANGCTLADEIGACAGVRNHGQYVSCVDHTTAQHRSAERISGRDKGRIQSCAARARIP